MSCSHNVVLLLDTAEPDLQDRVRLLSLRLLNFLACRAGLGQVRWSYRFLDSLGGRCRPPRRSDLRELGPRSWEECEEELGACWERARGSRTSRAHSSRALLTQTALKETLSDFQWDRPDITSPAKPAALRGRRGIPVDEPLQAQSPSQSLGAPSSRNAVFLLSPCPHSCAQLGHFAAASEGIGLQHLADKLLPKGVQDMLTNKRVTLYWLDTSDWAKVWSSSDHSGYWTMIELMQLVGGRILPSESLMQCFNHQTENGPLLPFDSSINYLICNEPDYRIRFPQQEGIVFFMEHGVDEQWECAVTLEPISMNEIYFRSLMNIKLKGTVQNWNQNGSIAMDTWVLGHSSKDSLPCICFQHLLQTLKSRGLHMVADVCTGEDLALRTGILSPISESVAVLNVICNERAIGIDQLLLHRTVNEASQDIPYDLPDIVSSVLSHVYNSDNISTTELPVPEWVEQELSQSSQWTSSIVERWYPLSDASGASCNLMEAFRLINAASSDERDEQSTSDVEIGSCLSEFYQKKSNDESGIAGQGENRKKRGLPRTPVRQKMKTMPRSLQMLNVARLNVKAQKSHPEGVLPATNEKNSLTKRRSADQQEEKGKPLKPSGFKTEEELISFLKEDYDKTVFSGNDSLLTRAKDAITVIKSYLKSNSSKQVEIDCMAKIRNLLKTSKAIRRHYGNNQNKAAKLRECQIQVILRLEMCVQCPSLQTNADELEQTVEEMTDMLRILSLTEDPTFLTKFLQEDVLVTYVATIPKILADLYFGLGTQIPEDLALALPADFFSDDSVVQEGKTPMYSQPSMSRVPSVVPFNSEADQLEELRTRSAKKRSSTMARHRSVTESSHSSRQIELPKVPKRQLNKENSQSNLIVMVEKLKLPLPPQPQKEAEATKVRRNLFIQENRSPTKRCNKMPRSQSVSAVEGLKHKRSMSHGGTNDHYMLLTKKVSETPLHKQISNRRLHKQIKGRHSDSTPDIGIVEESPEKSLTEIDLRRSPRIKQLTLTRKNSSFYASQPKSRNVERLHSGSQKSADAHLTRTHLAGTPLTGSRSFSEVKNPNQLLFGEVQPMNSAPVTRSKIHLSDTAEPGICQTPGKILRYTPQKTIPNFKDVPERNKMIRKSPRTPVRTPKRLKTPSKSSSEKKTVAKNLGKYFSPSKLEEHSPFKSYGRRSERLAQITPGKESSPNKLFVSPLMNLISPPKEGEGRLQVFKSPLRTPKRGSNRTTPAKQEIQTPCTPRKPHTLLETIAGCATPTRYIIGTPEKLVSPLVSHTHTPTQCVERDLSVALSCAPACTPEKAQAFSPRKPTTLKNIPMSPYTSITKSKFTRSPSIQASDVEYNAFLLCPLSPDTPRKSPLGIFKSAYSQKSIDTIESPTKTPAGHTVFTKAEENNDVLSIISTPFQRVSSGEDFGHCRSVSLSETCILSPSMSLTSKGVSPNLKNVSPPKGSSYKCRDADVVCERLDSSLASPGTSESFVNSSQTTEESIDISDARVVPAEGSGLKMKVLITRKSNSGTLKCLSTTPNAVRNTTEWSSTPSYGLRCTPDRRQREAATRLGTPEIPATFSTPKSRRKIIPPVIPTYAVELEMQASGLPKLRIKRTDSNSTLDVDSIKKTEHATVSRKRKGDESPSGEKWCNKHALKIDSACVSPSCARSSHNTPGKSSLQTYICQSYTPNRCASNAASPQPDVGVPWTPSPKHKEKTSTDIINNWPRRKKAAALNATNISRGEKNQDNTDSMPSTEEEGEGAVSEHERNNVLSLEDFELEGVYKLQEQSPTIELQSKAEGGTFGLKSRKRGFHLVSPTKETQHQVKRSRTTSNACEDMEKVTLRSETCAEAPSVSRSISSNLSSSNPSSCDDVFNISGFTPPNNVLKSSLSVSGLLALTQSPLLYQGKTPSSKRKGGMRGGDLDQGTPKEKRLVLHTAADSDESPFSKSVSVPPITKTYTRKKLIT
ncbi:treslin isoform X2 [Ascaphus truei]|uniref:treslin isoform X2 n=1 Tax=Ascaphus truei TaxID=8439 RepID=UPI003F5AA8AC